MNQLYYFFTIIVFFLISSMPASSQVIELKTAGQKLYPKYFKIGGKTLGICTEIITAVEKKTGIKITGVDKQRSFKRIKLSLKTGNIDVFFGITKNEEREKQYVYIDPPLYSVNFVFVKRSKDEVEIISIDDIKNLGKKGKILAPPGTGAYRFLKKQNGLVLDDGGQSIEANLTKLMLGRGRFYFHHDLGIKSTIKKENLGGQLTVIPKSFKKFHHYVAFSKKAPPEAVRKVKIALQNLQEEGILERIYLKYIFLD